MCEKSKECGVHDAVTIVGDWQECRGGEATMGVKGQYTMQDMSFLVTDGENEYRLGQDLYFT